MADDAGNATRGPETPETDLADPRSWKVGDRIVHASTPNGRVIDVLVERRSWGWMLEPSSDGTERGLGFEAAQKWMLTTRKA